MKALPFIVVASLAYLLGLVSGVYQCRSEAQTMKLLNANHRINAANQALGGTTTGQGLSINWRGADTPHGADPIDAISAAADRLRHLQTTTAGGNETAKALWEVEQCLDKLKGIYESGAKPRADVGSGAGFGGTQETEKL